jgi:hypothetical protein
MPCQKRRVSRCFTGAAGGRPDQYPHAREEATWSLESIGHIVDPCAGAAPRRSPRYSGKHFVVAPSPRVPCACLLVVCSVCKKTAPCHDPSGVIRPILAHIPAAWHGPVWREMLRGCYSRDLIVAFVTTDNLLPMSAEKTRKNTLIILKGPR